MVLNRPFLLQKTDLMKQVAHQTIVMQYILELAKTMKVPPIACVSSFFDKYVVSCLSRDHPSKASLRCVAA